MADAKTPIVRQMSVAPTTSAPSQSTGNSGPSGTGGTDHTKTPQVKRLYPAMFCLDIRLFPIPNLIRGNDWRFFDITHHLACLELLE